jgi:hypothetical protein
MQMSRFMSNSTIALAALVRWDIYKEAAHPHAASQLPEIPTYNIHILRCMHVHLTYAPLLDICTTT